MSALLEMIVTQCMCIRNFPVSEKTKDDLYMSRFFTQTGLFCKIRFSKMKKKKKTNNNKQNKICKVCSGSYEFVCLSLNCVFDSPVTFCSSPASSTFPCIMLTYKTVIVCPTYLRFVVMTHLPRVFTQIRRQCYQYYYLHDKSCAEKTIVRLVCDQMYDKLSSHFAGLQCNLALVSSKIFRNASRFFCSLFVSQFICLLLSQDSYIAYVDVLISSL